MFQHQLQSVLTSFYLTVCAGMKGMGGEGEYREVDIRSPEMYPGVPSLWAFSQLVFVVIAYPVC